MTPCSPAGSFIIFPVTSMSSTWVDCAGLQLPRFVWRAAAHNWFLLIYYLMYSSALSPNKYSKQTLMVRNECAMIRRHFSMGENISRHLPLHALSYSVKSFGAANCFSRVDPRRSSALRYTASLYGVRVSQQR